MVEENGNSYTKPVTETVKALAGTPTLLVLVILNVLILAMITYLVKGRAEIMQQERADILQALHNCINQK